MILSDLLKAFDTINHENLLKKFEATSFSDQYIRWFWSYLFKQIFFKEIKNQLSDYFTLYFRIIDVPYLKIKSIFIY